MLSKLKSLFNPKKGDVFVGLINEDGATKSASGENLSMGFTFIAYTKNNGNLLNKEAVVIKEIPDFNYSTKGLEPLTIVKVIGEQIDYHGQNRIVLHSVLKVGIKHPELESLRVKRLIPVEYESAFFGKFVLNRQLNWFEGKGQWKEKEVEIILFGAAEELDEIQSTAIALFEKDSEWDVKLRNQISKELLSLKNESWLDEGEVPLTKEVFEGSFTLDSIVVFPNQCFEAWFDDGDIFWGHGVKIDGNLDGTIEDATLVG